MPSSPTLTADVEPLTLEPTSRAYRPRQAYWQRRHYAALVRAPIQASGEDSLIGYARSFAALLEASAPQIEPDELIVGSALAVPEEHGALNLGRYDAHYPPGHATILSKGLVGIRNEARQRLAGEGDIDKRAFLSAVELSYAAATSATSQGRPAWRG